jgi:hypothetical protein
MTGKSMSIGWSLFMGADYQAIKSLLYKLEYGLAI